MTTTSLLSPEQLRSWEDNGFLLVSGLFSGEEVAQIRDHFMAIQREAQTPNSPLRKKYAPLSPEQSGGDVLKEFPRVMHPHNWDELSRRQMLNERVQNVLRDLFGEEPIAAQSMFYFKPMGARGQALHQDNFYLNVRPGTCIAAWLAIDDADEENGGMNVVPGSHKLGVQCPGMADMTQSFTTEEVAVPEGHEAVPARMKAGDVLFFNGSMIHGSTPNVSKDRFRRAFICHYVGDSTVGMNGGYYPLTSFDGQTITREWVEGQLNTCGAEDWATYTKLRQAWERDHNAASGAAIH
ncbi:hypothetical protein IAD21_01897 [Abditibacteriota bacterium]|nr:hypothetical protein IAD21_01897 [Abditibacteriota bacterium]